MSFGLRTWNENGVVQMDTDSFTYQVIYNQLHSVDGANSYTIQIPGFTTEKCVASLLPLGTVASESAWEAMPFIFQNEGSVLIRPRPESSTSVGCKISFRLLVMRFKN